MAFRNDISKEEMGQLETAAFGGLIHVIDREEDVDLAVSRLSQFSILGFDTETRPSFRKGEFHRVSLLQLASRQEAFLFRLHHTGLPAGLTRILSDPAISKVGVAIRDDIRKLQTIRNFKPEGFIDLQDYSGKYGIESNSLRKLAAIVLGVRISKTQQTSNWEARNLDEQQIIYAATDAWVGLEIFLGLNGHSSK